MTKWPDSPRAFQTSPSTKEGLARVLRKYPLRALWVCGLLSLSSTGVREYIQQVWWEVIHSADEQWRRTFHPGYRWNGQYEEDGPTYYNDALKQGYIQMEDK